ncbi:unnamed protein product [Symbiodinium necroappetens]|uniref:Uncharacterized protein n=1 Tax=Symbiodinium necroappetens TaxID=1628268 RepID=A0A812TQP5_9DINO|nr:unnamed protein product [Symbiodinium necroappetens]
MELPLSVLLILVEDADNMVLDMEATGSGIERDEHGRDMEAWEFTLQEGKSYMMHGVGEAVTHMKTQVTWWSSADAPNMGAANDTGQRRLQANVLFAPYLNPRLGSSECEC